MRPSERKAIRALTDALLAELREFKKWIQDQKTSARRTYDEARTELRKIPWASITSIILDTKNDRDSAKSDQTKNRAQQDKLVFWTRLNVIVSIFVLVIYTVTLWEVKKSSDAAHDAAVAAQDQANVSAEAVDLQDFQMRHNRLEEARQERSQTNTLKQNQRQFQDILGQMRAQTAAQVNAANTASAQLESTQRPWMKLSISIIGPLHFDNAENASFKFRFSGKNIGPGIATQVFIRSEGVASNPSITEVKKFCEETVSMRIENKPTLFPGDDPLGQEEPVFISRQQIRVFQNEMAARFHSPEVRFPAGVIGCIAYSATFDPSRRYYTGAGFRIESTENNVLMIGEDIPAERLSISLQQTVTGNQIQNNQSKR